MPRVTNKVDSMHALNKINKELYVGLHYRTSITQYYWMFVCGNICAIDGWRVIDNGGLIAGAGDLLLVKWYFLCCHPQH